VRGELHFSLYNM